MEQHLYLAHHGIKGQKWGVRRFQNSDGSLTSAGKKRYGVIGGVKSSGRVLVGDVQSFSSARKARKAAKQRRWDRDDALDADHDRKVTKIGEDLKRGKITKREANRQYDSAWKEYSDAVNASKRQYKQDKRDINTARIESHAKTRMDESKRILGEHKSTILSRHASDEFRGTSKIMQSRADLRKARDAYKRDKSPENRKAYHNAIANRVILANYALTPNTIGAYDRYRENGSSIAVSLLKAGTFGSLLKHAE